MKIHLVSALKRNIYLTTLDATFAKTRLLCLWCSSRLSPMKIPKILFCFTLVCLLSNLSQSSNTNANADTKSRSFNADSFYDVIVQNNIFRSLGWRAPKRQIPYQLIGTIIYENTKKRSTAIIQETTKAKPIHSVSIGDKIGDTLILNIQPKQVTLEIAGEQTILHITLSYLNSQQRSRTSLSPARDPSMPITSIDYIPPKVVRIY